MLNKAPHQEDVWESGGIAPRVLNIGARWKWVVSFAPRPLYPRYQLDRRLDKPQSRSGQGLIVVKWRTLSCHVKQMQESASLKLIKLTCVTYMPHIEYWRTLMLCTFPWGQGSSVLYFITFVFWSVLSSFLLHMGCFTCQLTVKDYKKVVVTLLVMQGLWHHAQKRPELSLWGHASYLAGAAAAGWGRLWLGPDGVQRTKGLRTGFVRSLDSQKLHR
jgi:hypothetical protein